MKNQTQTQTATGSQNAGQTRLQIELSRFSRQDLETEMMDLDASILDDLVSEAGHMLSTDGNSFCNDQCGWTATLQEAIEMLVNDILKEVESDAAPFQYFTATLWGWNGSRSRVIAQAEGCWDTEEEAEQAIQAATDKAFEHYCDGNGLIPGDGPEFDDEDDCMERFYGDYQRTSVSFICIPTINGRLDHEQTQEVQPGELPMLKALK